MQVAAVMPLQDPPHWQSLNTARNPAHCGEAALCQPAGFTLLCIQRNNLSSRLRCLKRVMKPGHYPPNRVGPETALVFLKSWKHSD